MGSLHAKCPQCWDPLPCGCPEDPTRGYALTLQTPKDVDIMAVDFSKALKKAGSLWKGARTRAAEESGGSEFDDGKYLARLIKGEVGKSEAGRLQITWHWKFMEGDYEGQIKYAYQGLETEDNQMYLAKDLEKLGYDTTAIDSLAEDLQGILDDIRKVKPSCRITLKTKGDFQNVFINRLLTEVDDEDEDEDKSDDDDDKPSKKKGKGKAKDDDDEEVEDDDEKTDDEDEDDDDKSSKKKSKKKPAKKDDDDEEEEDEEEDEEP